MRPAYFLLFLIAAGFLLLLSATSAQKPAPPAWQTDASLQTPVTIRSIRLTVDDALRSLVAPDRLQLTAAKDALWERVTVFASGRKASQVMADLDTLLGYSWLEEKADDGSTRWSLTPGMRVRQREQELYRLTRDRNVAPLFRLPDYLRIPEGEMERLNKRFWAHEKFDDPLLEKNAFYLNRSGPRLAINLLTTLSPEQREALVEDEYLLLSADVMNQRQRLLTRSMGIDTANLLARIGKIPDAGTPEASAQFVGQYGLNLTIFSHPVTGALIGYDYEVPGSASYTAGTMFGLPPPDDLLLVRGSPYDKHEQQRTPKLPVYPALEALRFPKGFKLTPDPDCAWRKALAELAKHLTIPIYSDDYNYIVDPYMRTYGLRYTYGPDEPLPNPADFHKLSLPAGLDALCNRYRYLWWYENGALFFRSRTWFREKRYEIPAPVETALQEQLKAKGAFDRRSIELLSTLTTKQLMALWAIHNPYQWNNGPSGHREFRNWMYSLASRQPVYRCLQAFMKLSEQEKTKAMSPEGLGVVEMRPEYRNAYLRMLVATRGMIALDHLRDAKLQVFQRDYPLPAEAKGLRRCELTFLCWKVEKEPSGPGVGISYKPPDQDKTLPKQ